MSGIKTETAASVNQILFMTQPYAGVSVVVANTGVSADANGKKILKAGTPISGNLEARTTAFVKATTTSGTSNATAVLLYDVDVTEGNENATAVIFGFVDTSKLDSATQALITSEVKTALKGNVTFLK
jgi:hypothetical protein